MKVRKSFTKNRISFYDISNLSNKWTLILHACSHDNSWPWKQAAAECESVGEGQSLSPAWRFFPGRKGGVCLPLASWDMNSPHIHVNLPAPRKACILTAWEKILSRRACFEGWRGPIQAEIIWLGSEVHFTVLKITLAPKTSCTLYSPTE